MIYSYDRWGHSSGVGAYTFVRVYLLAETSFFNAILYPSGKPVPGFKAISMGFKKTFWKRSSLDISFDASLTVYFISNLPSIILERPMTLDLIETI